MDSSSDRIRLYKRLWGSIVLLLVVWLLLVSVLENRATKIMKKQRTNSIHSKMNLNFMSIKRRVPNGPDPIHNRYINVLIIYAFNSSFSFCNFFASLSYSFLKLNLCNFNIFMIVRHVLKKKIRLI